MHLSMLLEMAAEGFGDRVAFGLAARRADLRRARPPGTGAAARGPAAAGVERVGLVDVNSEAVPILLFGSALAGRPVRAAQLPARPTTICGAVARPHRAVAAGRR